MSTQKRIRDYGIEIGKIKPGKLNSIADVLGVTVGHSTINEGRHKTGVTAILPHQGNLYKEKLIAACHVFNGYGKSIGFIQIEELGLIETPILLCSTLEIPEVSKSLATYMINMNRDIGIETSTINTVVCETSDSYLRDIRDRVIEESHVFEAIQTASEHFLEGDVGAGRGMKTFGYKGGIGTSSRHVPINNNHYMVGVLVLANVGKKSDLTINYKNLAHKDQIKGEDSGSITIVVATDAPLTSLQLKRLIKRTDIGFIRLGGYKNNTSGEVTIGFSTANKIMHEEKKEVTHATMWNEFHMDSLYRAVAEATEEAILNAMITADTVKGRDDHKMESLQKDIKKYL